MKMFFLFAAFVLAGLLTLFAGDEWPLLPTSGFVKGRVANEQDVVEKRAAFAAKAADGSYIGKPLKIQIPQYALCDRDGTTVKAIILQAEEAQGIEMVAFKAVGEAKFSIGLLRSCKLLGTKPPASDPPGSAAASVPASLPNSSASAPHSN
jgi:hypothetical protein